jgi:hypothetical protein
MQGIEAYKISSIAVLVIIARPRKPTEPECTSCPPPVGSGKTSFGLAFVAALVQCADEDEGNCAENDDTNTLPYGCLVVVNQIEKADTTFRDLNTLLPDQVAVWTTEHDPNCKLAKEERKVPEPAAQFTKDDLQYYPVAVVTHAFFGGKGSRKARQLFHKGKLQPRALTVIDERIEEVTIYDIALSSAQKVLRLRLPMNDTPRP